MSKAAPSFVLFLVALAAGTTLAAQAPESPAPESPAPESPAPESPAPESPAPESPAPKDAEAPPPSGKLDAAALREITKQLEQDLREKDPFVRERAVRRVAKIDDDGIVRRLGRVLRDESRGVRSAALEALRHSENARALDVLLQSGRHLAEEEGLAEAWFLALGQHGDAKALPALLDDAWVPDQQKTIEARLLAVSHIRDRRSVEAILDLWNKRRNGRWEGRARNAIRAALVSLTGHGKAESLEEWRAWWRKEGKDFAVPKEPAELAPRQRAVWERTWETPEQRREREAKQEEKEKEQQEKKDRRGRGERK